jgi:lariat debranching enzyme
LEVLERKENIKIDLLICCGDFQAIRNEYDLSCLNVPPKYREMGTFYKFFSGAERPPYPTIFIGGNHEAMNHLWELYFGGWTCENIYFMGYSNVIRVNGIRIAGLSGIYKPQDYHAGGYT